MQPGGSITEGTHVRVQRDNSGLLVTENDEVAWGCRNVQKVAQK